MMSNWVGVYWDTEKKYCTEKEDYLFCALLGLVYEKKAYLTMFTMKLTKELRFQTLTFP